jgi:hypothetical protein
MVMQNSDEGEGRIADLYASMAGQTFGRRTIEKALPEREKRERRATATEKQRARSKSKTKLINFKATEEFADFLAAFAVFETESAGSHVTKTHLIELAIKELAKTKGFR